MRNRDLSLGNSPAGVGALYARRGPEISKGSGYTAWMTEAEWLACTDLFELLRQVKGEGRRRNVPCVTSERKLRLFACACCRRIWPLLIDERSREAVDFGEPCDVRLRAVLSLKDGDEVELELTMD